MDVEKIKMVNTKKIAKEVIYYDVIDSTQQEAKRRIKENSLIDGTILIADNQTNGIGTKGRTWHTSKNENITMTMVLFPECDVKKLEGLTIKIAQIMQNTIQKLYGILLTIKEPNDLLLNGKKIGGILTESATNKEKVKHLIIGIGFNVNEINFAKEIENIATSLKKEYNKQFNIEEILIEFITEFDDEIQKIYKDL